MAETDIYKNREAMPQGNRPPDRKGRRRVKSQRAFDDHSRKRRSRNSGSRRLLHLFRKSENEKLVWGLVGIVFVIALIIIAVWQFVIVESQVRKQEKADDYIEQRIPATTEHSQ